MARLPLVLFPLLALGACDEPQPLPGDEVIGTYTFRAVGEVDGGCPGLKELQVASFEFTGTVTRCLPDSPSPLCAGSPGRAFFTRESVSRDAGFDGQILEVDPISAPIALSACGTERTRIVDAMRVALFSASQADAVATPFVCPPHALDGGVPAPDGSVLAPGPTANGFDAPYACGEVVDTIINDDFDGGADAGVCRSDAGAALPSGTCTVVFRVTGERL